MNLRNLSKVGSFRTYVIGDIHFGCKNPHLLNELSEIFLKNLEADNDVNMVVIAGDYYHSKLSLNDKASKDSMDFINKLLYICNDKGIMVRMIKGTASHDVTQLDVFRSLQSKYDFKIFNTVENEVIEHKDYVLNLLYVPEEYMEDQEEYYRPYTKDALTDGAKYDMIFFHGTYDFAAYDSQVIESERPISNAPVFSYKEWSNYAYGPIMGGHIHSGIKYKNKVFYTGSYTRWSYGEDKHHKGYLVCDYNPTTMEYTVERVSNTLAPTYSTIDVNDVFKHTATLEDKVEALKTMLETDTNVRLMIDSNVDDATLAILRESFSGYDNLNLDTRKRVEEDNPDNDSTFDFISSTLPPEAIISKYIYITKNLKIEEARIKELLVED